jgi:glycosyltransferase involved in cell wall biosynthesis
MIEHTPRISLCMTTFNRAPQLAMTLRSIRDQNVPDLEIVLIDDGVDDEITRWVAQSFEVDKYVQLRRPASVDYRNAARPLNIGLRLTAGEIVILQNAECMHIGDVILPLVSRVTEHNAVFAKCVALDIEGKEEQVYCGTANPRPYFFCGAMLREHFIRLRGFDEDYVGYGYEDDDFADRLRREHISFEFADDIVVHHQWHEPAGIVDMSTNECMYKWKLSEPTVRNMQREWGKI